jgi:hypothetical protein
MGNDVRQLRGASIAHGYVGVRLFVSVCSILAVRCRRDANVVADKVSGLSLVGAWNVYASCFVCARIEVLVIG